MHGLSIAYGHNSCEWHYSCYIINFTEEANSTVTIFICTVVIDHPPKPSCR